MKPAALLILLVPFIAQSAVIEGAYFCLRDDRVVINEVRIEDPRSMKEPGSELRIGVVDYFVTLLHLPVHVREGHWSFVDEVLGLPRLFSQEWVLSGRWVTVAAFRGDGTIISTIAVQDVSNEGRAKRLPPGISISVEGASFRDVSATVNILLEHLQLFDGAASVPLRESIGRERLRTFIDFLEQTPNSESSASRSP